MTQFSHPAQQTIDAAVLRLLMDGKAESLHQAESAFLDSAIPDILALLAGPMSNEELAEHPYMRMLLAHGSRGWEDSLL